MTPPIRFRLPWQVFPAWFLVLYRNPLVFLTCLLLVPLSLVCVWLSTEGERRWRAQESADLLVAARLASQVMTEELSRIGHLEEAVAARPDLIAALKRQDQAALSDELRFFLDLTPHLTRAAIMDGTGRLLAEAQAELPATPNTFPQTPPQAPPGQVSRVYLYDEVSGEKALGMSSLIQEGETVLGAVQAQLRLGAIARWLEKIRIEPGGFLYVVDHEGFLVAYPFQLLPGRPKNISAWPPVTAPASAQGALIRFQQGRPKRPWTAAAVAVDPFGWRVVAQQPDAAMLKPLHQLVASFVSLIVFLAAVIGVLALRWTRLHDATLGLLAQQTRLLKDREQERLRGRLHRPPRDDPGGGHGP